MTTICCSGPRRGRGAARTTPRRLDALDIDNLVEELVSTSLRGRVDLDRAYRQARQLAALGLRRHGEDAAPAALPDACPYAVAQVADDAWVPANRHGLREMH